MSAEGSPFLRTAFVKCARKLVIFQADGSMILAVSRKQPKTISNLSPSFEIARDDLYLIESSLTFSAVNKIAEYPRKKVVSWLALMSLALQQISRLPVIWSHRKSQRAQILQGLKENVGNARTTFRQGK